MTSKKIFKSKKGMTIIEMIVAIAIFTIGMEGFTILFVRAWQNNAYTIEMGQSAMIISQSVNKIVGHIRGARQADNGSYPIVSAGDNDLVLYADYDKDDKAERLHFYKSNQDVLMGVREPSGSMPVTYASGDENVVKVASHIINDVNTPIFEYYGQNYPSTATPMSTPASVASVRMVKIHLHINVNPNRAPDNIEMQSFVELRNLNDREN